MKKIFTIFTMVLTIGLFNGCAVKNMHYSYDFSKAVSIISDEFDDYSNSDMKQKSTILMTSMVNVHNFKETSDFGRLYSDSLLTNLKRSGWNVVDYRGKELVTQVKNGEFYLNRKDLQQLPIDNYFVLVGTFGVYADKLVLNVRMINSKTGEVLLASNSLIEDQEIIDSAQRSHCVDLSCESQFKIRVLKDECSTTERCEVVK